MKSTALSVLFGLALAVTALFGAVVGTSLTPPAPLAGAAARRASPAVVAVMGPDGSYGSGWVVRSRLALPARPEMGYLSYVVTCAHVVEGREPLMVRTQGMDLACFVVVVNDVLDVAIVCVATPTQLPVFELATASPLLAQPLTALGYPETGPDDLWVIPATYAAPDRAAMSAGPGISGGPVIDQQGRVVGLVRGWIGDVGGLGWLVPLDAVRQVVDGR